MKYPSNGFLYSVYSEDGRPNKFFNEEFLLSLDSLKSTLPECHITLYTNILFENIYSIDNVIYDESMVKSHISKAHGLYKSPYNKTIFLDSDIIIHRDIIKDIFIVLESFDFTACYGNFAHMGEIFPDLNTGLLGIKKTPTTQLELQKWINEFESSNAEMDQPSFRNVFMRNKKKFHILPWWFQHRSQHFIDYFSNIVTTHSHLMCKEKTTEEIVANLRNKNS